MYHQLTLTETLTDALIRGPITERDQNRVTLASQDYTDQGPQAGNGPDSVKGLQKKRNHFLLKAT